MKTKRYILGILLAVTCSIQMAGQTLVNGEAFYIYRNDGDFNGFFYDEVQDMRYSKVGLDSIEYDEFVVQEIVTADSLYRIPLCAIDSIGFVQPELMFQPNVVIAENSDLIENLGTAYQPTEDTYEIRISTYDLALNLLPKEGDVLVSTTKAYKDYNNVSNTGFAIRVETAAPLYEGSSTYVVTGKDVEGLDEIFKQFISVENVYSDENGQEVRRMAGLDKIVTEAGDASINLLNLSGTFIREFGTSDRPFSITLDYGLLMRLRATYEIRKGFFFFKLAMDEEISAQLGFSATQQMEKETEIPLVPTALSAIKFPACLPIFETKVLPDAFVKLKGSLSIKSTLPKVRFYGKQMFIMSDMTGNVFNFKSSSNITGGDINSSAKVFESGDTRLQLSGELHAGLKFNNTISTNSWLSKIFQSSIGITSRVGPKITGGLDISLPELAAVSGGGEEIPLSLMEQQYITLSPCTADVEAAAEVKAFGYPPEKAKFAEGSYSVKDWKWGLLPTVSSFALSHPDEKSKSATVNIKTDETMQILPVNIGVKIFKWVEDEASPWGYVEEKFYRTVEKHLSDNDYQFNVELPGSGVYRATLVRELMEHDYLGGVVVDNTTGGYETREAVFEVVPTVSFDTSQLLNIPATGNTKEDPVVREITYSTDGPINVDIDGANSTHIPDGHRIIVKFSPNTSPYPQKRTLYLRWYNSPRYGLLGEIKIPFTQAAYEEKEEDK